jgi:hypothetical protein
MAIKRFLLGFFAVLPLIVGPTPAFAAQITLLPATTAAIVNGTTTRQTLTIDPSLRTLSLLINVTSGGAATGTLQIFLEDSSDGGTTWDDLLSSNTFTFGAAAVTQHFFIVGGIDTSATQGAAAQQETLAAGTVRKGPFGNLVRIREKVSGISGSPTGPTYSISGVLQN